MEEPANSAEDLCIHGGGDRDRMGACNGAEIRVTQLQLHGSCSKVLLAQPSSHHFAEPQQSGFKLLQVARVLAKCMLMADGLSLPVLPDLPFKPAAGVFTTGFARQRRAPFAEIVLQYGCIYPQQITNSYDSHLVQL